MQTQAKDAVVWAVDHRDYIRFIYDYYWFLFPTLTTLLWIICCVAQAMHWACYNPRGCLLVLAILIVASLVFIGLYPAIGQPQVSF